MAEQEPPNDTRLHVSNLKWAIDDLQLREKFEECGKVTEARVVRDRRFNRSRGYGFITFEDATSAAEAMSTLNGFDFEGREISVAIALSSGPRRREPRASPPRRTELGPREVGDGERKEPAGPTVSKTKLHVSQLEWSTTDEKLRENFSAYGTVKDAHVVKDASDRSRGYGFVTFESSDNAEEAIQNLHGIDIDGREIQIEYARISPPRRTRGVGGGGGRGRRRQRRQRRQRRRQERINTNAAAGGPMTESTRSSKSHGDTPISQPTVAPQPAPKTRLYVTNLHFETTDETLKENFSVYGNVTDCRIIRNPRTNRSRGYAFVTFENETEAADAQDSLDGAAVDEQELKVEFARGRRPAKRRRGGFRGGGRFGYRRRGRGGFRGGYRGGRGRGRGRRRRYGYNRRPRPRGDNMEGTNADVGDADGDMPPLVQVNDGSALSPQAAEPPQSAEPPQRRAEQPERRAEQPDRRAEQPDRRAEQPDRRVEQPDRRAEQPDRRAEQPERRAEQPEHSPLPQEPKPANDTYANYGD